MQQTTDASAPPGLAGPFTLRPFRARGRADSGVATLHVHEWTASGLTVQGLVGLLDLASGAAAPDRAVVWPHERVDAVQVDQLAARMARGRHDPAPVLLVHEGEPGLRALVRDVVSGPPRLDRTVRDQRHRTWPVDELTTARLSRHLAGVRAVIADGHHRYAAHLDLVARGGPRWAQQVLVCLVDQLDAPLHLGAVHRVLAGTALDAVRSAASMAGLEHVTVPATEALAALGPRRLVACDDERGLVIALPDGSAPGEPEQELEVEALHRLLLPGLGPQEVEFAHDCATARHEAARRRGVCVLLPAVRIEDVTTVLRAGRLLPEKATSFQPKPRPGVLSRRLRDA